MIDLRARSAAANNADLYEAVFRAHGLRFDRSPVAFFALDPPPPYYSQMAILDPSDSALIGTKISAMTDRFTGTIGLKDGFATLDLTASGFEPLFDAQWFRREPITVGSDWSVIETPDQLLAWEAAWKTGGSPTSIRMFPPKILADPSVTFLVKWTPAGVVAGCIANLSEDCIGISNVFGEDATRDAARAVGALAPELPIVGYDRGPELTAALDAGFQTVGPLRVWIKLASR